MDPQQGVITPESLLNWFSIGKESSKINVLGCKTGIGLKSADEVDETPYIPSYKRLDNQSSLTDYAKYYIEEEERNVKQHLSGSSSDPIPGGSSSHQVVSTFDQFEEQSLISGVAQVAELTNENLTQVYSTYDFNHKAPSNLPIVKFKDHIISAIEANQVIIIEGSTGSGKTTQVPQYILDHSAKQGRYCNIIVTQPRRIAAISIAKRVCHERNWPLTGLVGYQIGMDSKTSADTRLTYVTTGVLLQRIISDKNMDHFTHVILDEIHERDQEMDFCLLVVRKLLRTVSKTVKVILMSATFDVSLFGEYFSMPVQGKLEPAQIISIEGKNYNVAEYWLNELCQLGPIPDLDYDKPCIPPESLKLAEKLIRMFDKIDVQEQEEDVGKRRFAKNRGSVLVFLPGIDEIKRFEQELCAGDGSLQNKWWVLPLHSSITIEEQTKVFEPPEEGFRKIILSTNIAESSITVSDIKYVIDFCLTKNLVCDHETNYTSLQVEWASKSNCKQRAGRAGRVSSGRVYRMVPERFYNNLLDYGIPEMKRCPLEQVVLHVKLLDLGEPKAILALALEPPNLTDIERTILVLKEVGALQITSNGIINSYDGDLTFVGKVLAKLPLDIRLGKLLILGNVAGCLESCIIIAAGLSLKSIFSNPFKKQLEAWRQKWSWAAGSFSDPLAILNVYQSWQRCIENQEFNRPGKMKEGEWCRRNFLQIHRLREMQTLVSDLTKRLDRLNIRKQQVPLQIPQGDSRDSLILKLVLCGAFYPFYFSRQEMDEVDVVRNVGGGDPLTTVYISGLPQDEGVIYHNALQDVFSGLNSDLKIHFEGSKAFIEFLKSNVMKLEMASNTDKDQNIKSQVHEAIYLAVKMRQLRLPLELKLFSGEETKRRMDFLKQSQESKDNFEKQVGLRTGRITSISSCQSTLKQVPLPGLQQTTIQLYITEILDVGHFYAHYGDTETFQRLNYLQNIVNSETGTNMQPIATPIVPGLICLAPFLDEGCILYYRARVEKVQSNNVEVFFVDYGNTDVVTKSDLRNMDTKTIPDLEAIQMQAFECMLSEIRPSLTKYPNGTWTDAARKSFVLLVRGKTLHARIYSVVHGIIRLELIKHETGERQVNINNVIKLKPYDFAEHAEEGLLSKQNHELRERATNFLLGQLEVDPCGDNTQSNDFYIPPNMDSQLGAGYSGRSRTKILRGPFSPLETRFHSLTRLGSSRSIRVEQDSVNSVILEPEPQDKCSRMLVGSYVNLNPSADVIIVRSPTLMPNIHGLLPVVALLFAPTAEIRTDIKRTRYTGALCGLGFDPDTGQPLYPDHDMELVFDTKIDLGDVVAINGVRLGISLSFPTSNEGIPWNNRNMLRIQNRTREQLINLVCKKREQVEPFDFPRIYRWDQIPEDHKLVPSKDSEEDPGTHVLPMLSTVALAQNTVDMIGHIKMLHAKAETYQSDRPENTCCEICNVTVTSNRELALHLNTTQHKQNEFVMLEG